MEGLGPGLSPSKPQDPGTRPACPSLTPFHTVLHGSVQLLQVSEETAQRQHIPLGHWGGRGGELPLSGAHPGPVP